jgi:hypothetical protein
MLQDHVVDDFLGIIMTFGVSNVDSLRPPGFIASSLNAPSGFINGMPDCSNYELIGIFGAFFT